MQYVYKYLTCQRFHTHRDTSFGGYDCIFYGHDFLSFSYDGEKI